MTPKTPASTTIPSHNHQRHKALVTQFCRAAYDFDATNVRRALENLFHRDARAFLAHPFENLGGPDGFFTRALAPLHHALPDLERRDTIIIAGDSLRGDDWVGCCGYYTGTFRRSWLGIPPTGHQVVMRFHEFFRMADGVAVEMQGLWDIPEVMRQAGVWPMGPSLGREWHVPGPATQDGVSLPPWDEVRSHRSRDLVARMLAALGKFAQGGVAAMELERYWHPRCNWYGPSGIGTGRGVNGFRHWHQIPFLRAMPDREGSLSEKNLFGDGNFVAYTAWPGMRATITHDGWMGIAPSGQKITMRSLDFWRCERNTIRENWVLVDLLHVYHQIGVDVLARMEELSRPRRSVSLS